MSLLDQKLAKPVESSTCLYGQNSGVGNCRTLTYVIAVFEMSTTIAYVKSSLQQAQVRTWFAGNAGAIPGWRRQSRISRPKMGTVLAIPDSFLGESARLRFLSWVSYFPTLMRLFLSVTRLDDLHFWKNSYSGYISPPCDCRQKASPC